MHASAASSLVQENSVDNKGGRYLLRPGIYWELLAELMQVVTRVVLPRLNIAGGTSAGGTATHVCTDTFMQLLTSLRRHKLKKDSLLTEMIILRFLDTACTVVTQFNYHESTKGAHVGAPLFRRADRRMRPPDLATYHDNPPMIGVWALGCIAYEMYFLEQISTSLLRDYYRSSPITSTQEIIRLCLAADPRERISMDRLRAKIEHAYAAEERAELFLASSPSTTLKVQSVNEGSEAETASSADTEESVLHMRLRENVALSAYIPSNPYIFPAAASVPRRAEPLQPGTHSPLIEAVQKQNTREVRRLIATGKAFEYLGRYDQETGRTALMVAAETGCEEIVCELVNLRYAPLEASTDDLEENTEVGITMCLDRWIEHVNSFTVQCFGYKPVTEEKLAALMEMGQTGGLFCALSLALRAGHWSCVRQLVAYEGGFVNFTPLMVAAVTGDADLAQRSLAFLGSKCESVTAAMLAAIYGSTACLEVMLSTLTTDTESRILTEFFGKSNQETGCMNALMFAILCGHQVAAMTILLRLPSIAKTQNLAGQTAAALAAARGYDNLLVALLPNEFTITDRYGRTLVPYAAGVTAFGPGSRVCLEAVANFFMAHCHLTELMYSVIVRSVDTIDILDQNTCEQAGRTDLLGRCALMYAIETHNSALVPALLSLEATMPYKRRASELELPVEGLVTSNIIDHALDIQAYAVLPGICTYFAENPTAFMRSILSTKRDGTYVTHKTPLMKLADETGIHADDVSSQHLTDRSKVTSTAHGRMSALSLAAHRSDPESVCALLCELCIGLSPLKPALHYAIRAQNVSCANLLLAEVPLWGGTYLMAYAAIGDAPAVERLLGLKVDIGKHSKKGWTALMFAARYGHRGCVELLAEYEEGLVTGPEYQSGVGLTALIIAIIHNQLACAEVLAHKERDIITKSGISALQFAETMNRHDIVAVLKDGA